MRTRSLHLWEVVTTGYWFLPAVMLIGSVALGYTVLHIDRHVIGDVDWFYTGGADGARTLLSTVAASTITVAGVVFSITIASLTQASSQFGPRLLRNFMRDTGNQIVLGTFVSTFLFCLVILRTIRNQELEGGGFVPQLSVTVAALLAVASIAVLVYFIHHVSVFLQAPEVVGVVRGELNRVIAQLPRHHRGTAVSIRPEHDPLPMDFKANSATIESEREGYLQVVDYGALMELAGESDLLLRLLFRPGDFLLKGSVLAEAYPSNRCPPDLGKRLNGAFLCGNHGTSEQDVEYAIRQLVEVGVRALSAGTNDPFTAINCIDALGSAICHAARTGLPGPLRFDAGGHLCLITPVTTFEGFVDSAFHQIRQYGKGHVAVTIRLLEVLTACTRQIYAPAQRQVLLKHAEMILSQAKTRIVEPRDGAVIQRRWDLLLEAMESTRINGLNKPA